MSRSIKQFVVDRWNMGMKPYHIWQEAMREFPHHCCGWNYVRGISKKLQMDAARQARKEEEARCLSRD